MYFIKRTKGTDPDELIFMIGQTTFDFPNLTVKGPNTDVRLTQKEADLLRFFCLNANRVIKREEVLTKVWGKDDYFLGRSMDVFITKIRKYLKEETEIEIQTIHGVVFDLLTLARKLTKNKFLYFFQFFWCTLIFRE
jgi:DNA-binding response OmpR family regulator